MRVMKELSRHTIGKPRIPRLRLANSGRHASSRGCPAIVAGILSVVVSALVAGCPAWSDDPVIREYGRWHVRVSYRNGKLVELDFGVARRIRDQDIERIAEIVELDLESLNLAGTNVTDASLALVKHCAKMRKLALDRTKVTDAGLLHLERFPNLVWLGLADTAITDKGLEYVGHCTQLERLRLEGTRVSDEGIPHLATLDQLEALYLDDTRVGDRALETLGRLRHLRELSLAGTCVSDKGLGHLRGLENLETLRLNRTQVSDTGLPSLEPLRKLRLLDLEETRVTEGGVAELRQRMPWVQHVYFGKSGRIGK